MTKERLSHLTYIKMKTKEYPKTFESFKRQDDYAVERRLGCSVYDLPDSIAFSDYWNDDCKTNADEYWNMVEAATEDLLNDNGFELDLY